MPDNINKYKKFNNGICLERIDSGAVSRTETGITQEGAVWNMTNKLRAYLNGGVKELLMIADGYTLDFTIEDANSTIVMDNANFEVENTDGTQRNIKITSAKAGNTTVTLQENFTIGDGADVTITAEDAAGSITLDNASFEVEDTVGSGNTFKLINATDDASRSITMSENLTIGDGADVSITAEDNATSIVMDNANFEVESTDASQRNFKVTSAKAGNVTVTLEEDFEVSDGNKVTMVAEDAAATITLDNCGLEVEDTTGSGQIVKLINADGAGTRSLSLAENLTIGDGADVTITAEDTAGSIVLDKQTFEVEGEGTATRLLKLVNAADAAATLTISGTSGSVDQDVTSGSSPAFTSATLTTPVLNTSVSGTAIKDEDNMASNSASHLCTQQSIKAYVDAQIVAYDTFVELTDTPGSYTNANAIYSVNGAGNGVAETTVILTEAADNFTITKGTAVVDVTGSTTLVAEDAAGTITLDNCSLEIEDTVGSGNTIKIVNGTSDDSKTLTLNETFTIGDGNAGTLTYSAASKTLTVEDDSTINQDLSTDATPSFNQVKIADTNASHHLALDWSEDDSSDRTLDFKVNSGNRTVNLSGNLTVEAASTINQDVSSDASPTFASPTVTSITRDSADITVATTTSGDVNLNPVDKSVNICSAVDTSSNDIEIQFGDQTGGATGIRNSSGTMQFQNAGGAWTNLGSGSGGAEVIHLLRAVNLVVGDLDLTGNDTDFDGGGSITADSLSISTTAADLILTDQVIKYDPDADGSDDYFGFTKSIPRGVRGRTLEFSFEYKNDSTTNDDDFRFCIKIKDGASAGNISNYNLEAYYDGDGISKNYTVQKYIPSDCTEIEFGWQNTDTTTTVELYVDNIEISTYSMSTGELYNLTDWESFTPTGSWTGNVTYTGLKRRVGDSLQVQVLVTLTGAPTGTNLFINYPETPDTAKFIDGSANTQFFSHVAISDDNSSKDAHGVIYPQSATQFSVRYYKDDGTEERAASVTATAPLTFATDDKIVINMQYPVENWESTTKHVVLQGELDDVGEIVTSIRPYTDPPKGTIPVNDVTVGKTGTDYAGSDYYDLYEYMWGMAGLSTTSGHPFEISAAKGGSALADWDAGKTITIDFISNDVFLRTADGSTLNIGAFQDDATAVNGLSTNTTGSSHTHTINLAAGSSGSPYTWVGGTDSASNDGNKETDSGEGSPGTHTHGVASSDSETRPKSVGVSFFIRYIQTPIVVVTPSVAVAARYDTDAGQSFNSGDLDIVNFDSTTLGYDTHNAVTTGADWKFTCPTGKAGYYSVKAHIAFAQLTLDAAERAYIALYKNGTLYEYLDYYKAIAAHNVETHLKGSTDIYLDEGDYIDLRATQNSGGPEALNAAEENNSISISKIGMA